MWKLAERLWGKKEEEAFEQGPLFPMVRDCMVGVQDYARSHGGEIVLLGVDNDGDVHILMKGTCKGCPMAGITIKLGIESELKKLVPGTRKVVLRSR